MVKSALCTVIFLLTVLSLIGCAQKYLSSSARQLVGVHRVIAVVPPTSNPYPEAGENTMGQSINLQQRLYSWLMSRKVKNQLSVDVLRVRETNDLLEEAGYFAGKELSPRQICDLLGVDAILTSQYSARQKISGAESSVLGLAGTVVGAAGGAIILPSNPPTGSVSSVLELYDGRTGEMFWSYGEKVSVYTGGTPYDTRTSSESIDQIMSAASRNMPYFKRPRGQYKSFNF